MQSVARRTKPPPRFHIGPTDVGRRMTWDEFRFADLKPGYRYELIDGRLSVAATPNLRHSSVTQWVYGLLLDYLRKRPEIINHLAPNGTVFVPSRPELTVPQPDIAAYCGIDYDRIDAENFSWREVSPILVIEIVSPDSPDKDFFRNVELYELVPSIREYWIFNPLDGHRKTTLKVYRRRADKWQKPIDVAMGGEYTTKLLPGFRLRLDTLP